MNGIEKKKFNLSFELSVLNLALAQTYSILDQLTSVVSHLNSIEFVRSSNQNKRYSCLAFSRDFPIDHRTQMTNRTTMMMNKTRSMMIRCWVIEVDRLISWRKTILIYSILFSKRGQQRIVIHQILQLRYQKQLPVDLRPLTWFLSGFASHFHCRSCLLMRIVF